MRARGSVSNIAWPADDDEEALALAAKLGFSGVEIAPSKVFGRLDVVSIVELERYREKLRSFGLVIPALQAILFGVNDAHLFRNEEMRARLARHLTRVAEIAGALGAKVCVFGSPVLRDPGNLTFMQAMEIATVFFRTIAPRFAEHGTLLAFEANPPLYNCRFVTHTEDAAALVQQVAAAGFGLQFDAGTVFENQERPATVEAVAGIAAHCHASEPGLVPLGSSGRDHKMIGDALRRGNYRGWVSVEMRASDDWRAAMVQAAQVISLCYQD